jgi:hypothetical protein
MEIKKVLCQTRINNLVILPATIQLAGAEVELANRPGRNSFCRRRCSRRVMNMITLFWIARLLWAY